MFLPLYLQTLRAALKGWVLHRVKLYTDTHPDWTHLTRRELGHEELVGDNPCTPVISGGNATAIVVDTHALE